MDKSEYSNHHNVQPPWNSETAFVNGQGSNSQRSFPEKDTHVNMSAPGADDYTYLPQRDPSEKQLLGGSPGYEVDSAGSDDTAGETSRGQWGRKAEYLLSMVGYCVGLGNVWRFPYVCIRNGGGAFLIPFFLCLTVCGLPLYFMEVSIGQFVSLSSIHAWNICPLFKGIGIAMNVLSLLCGWYYSMVLAWSLIFLVNSFKSPLPWTLCGQSWNTERCMPPQGGRSGQGGNDTGLHELAQNLTGFLESGGRNGTADLLSNGTVLSSVNASLASQNISSTEEFWIHQVLHLSPSLSEMGAIPWASGVALLAQAVIVYLCVVKGVSSVGKVVYVTATLPYILLAVFLIRGTTLDGALDGIIFYLRPDFEKLFRIQTWVEASVQVFYSLGPAWGGLITMASYNKFNNNCLRDSLILSFVCEGSSVFAGFAIFTILGHMAHTLNVPISDFAKTGPGLAFVVYPEAISYLPVPQLWGVLFFVMLFTLGLDSQFVMCETVLTTLCDLWPKLMGKRPLITKLVFFVILLLLSLPFATEGGMYLFQLVDWYFAAYSVMLLGIIELIVVSWIYGAESFFDDIELMLGHKPPYLFAILWRFISPGFLSIVLVSTLMTYGPPVFQGYHYTHTEVIFGWCMATLSFLPVPFYAIYLLLRTPGSFMQRLKTTCTPSSHWQPADVRLRDKYRRDQPSRRLCTFSLPCRSRSYEPTTLG